MAIEIEEQHLREPFMNLFKNNKKYFFQTNETGDIGRIYKRPLKWYNWPIQLTTNVFIYKDYIHIKLQKEYLHEVQNILINLSYDIKVKIEVF